LDDGKIYRKALYLMVKTMVSCRFSLKPIQWIPGCLSHGHHVVLPWFLRQICGADGSRCLRRWQRSILVTQPTHPALIEASFRSIQGPKKDLGKTEKRESLKAWRGKIFIAFGRWKLSQSFWTEGEMERGRIGGLVGWETFDDRLCRLGVELRLVIWFLPVWSNSQCLKGTWL
jgi:hypothetical protein